MAANSTSAYADAPKSGTGPGVLVLHSWWGLTDSLKDRCNQLADAGFTVVAPDLFDGEVARDDAHGEQLLLEPRQGREVRHGEGAHAGHQAQVHAPRSDADQERDDQRERGLGGNGPPWRARRRDGPQTRDGPPCPGTPLVSTADRAHGLSDAPRRTR
ncbi:dienelactone hydrolase family protein [uncultured Demequina sp.]|uniref:dienelactone hydrolase family protein n=1 Tax=uncultured Demequina sp. TaxID=693499 RepID=UPI0025FF447A|nr:dienelactone hydrolase family protein [uncultured Demequina sp.]